MCPGAQDPNARHGPYFEWGHMKGGKLVHRMVTPEQAAIVELAIANHRKAKKLMQEWEDETSGYSMPRYRAKPSSPRPTKRCLEIHLATDSKNRSYRDANSSLKFRTQ